MLYGHHFIWGFLILFIMQNLFFFYLLKWPTIKSVLSLWYFLLMRRQFRMFCLGNFILLFKLLSTILFEKVDKKNYFWFFISDINVTLQLEVSAIYQSHWFGDILDRRLLQPHCIWIRSEDVPSSELKPLSQSHVTKLKVTDL